ncbi:23S rRNA (guanosine(2251)-2'-O)-methyltransferase RlmB [Candidatus Tisiphia endosymbiont of Nemotelus uliginosus]|uniref:23S rRNA (guanosine(2251)-2'-O)-methyltransferase RlmB n=1 Tax=Candidatus Tisiphia endosymbiont of Nemotelus uliginosus TaxID=3077926 RepID=UPI0035C87F95
MTNNPKHPKDFYYIYGKHTVLAALKNPKRHIQNILCTEEIFSSNNNLLSKFPCEITKMDSFTRLFGLNQNHQGIAAYVKTIFLNNIVDINTTDPNCKIAVLDQVTDPQNIGAIIRSAASFNITAIILPTDNTPNENATIAKTASGVLELVQIIKVTNLRWALEYLKKQNFWIVGLDSNATQFLHPKILTGKVVIVLGSEDKGIRRLVKKTCDSLTKIAISNQIDSLNVSNAAAIVFYLSSLQ